MRLASLFLVGLSLPACGPQIRSAYYVPGHTPAPRVNASAMRIYEHTRPPCAFEEIGRVTGRPQGPTHSGDRVVNAMRRRAAEMGGDAIIGFSERSESAGSTIVPVTEFMAVSSESSATVYSGTVVRFTDPACSPPTD